MFEGLDHQNRLVAVGHIFLRNLALFRYSPRREMCEAISPSVATDMACGVGKAANRAGVALFTAASDCLGR